MRVASLSIFGSQSANFGQTSLNASTGQTSFNHYNPAGDVTRVSVVPRKVIVKIGVAENWWRGCRDKN